MNTRPFFKRILLSLGFIKPPKTVELPQTNNFPLEPPSRMRYGSRFTFPRRNLKKKHIRIIARTSRRVNRLIGACIIIATMQFANADTITTGMLSLQGDFDITDPYSETGGFGVFGPLLLLSKSGIFSDVPNQEFTLNALSTNMIWTLGTHQIFTSTFGIYGADSGRYICGIANDNMWWYFTAPNFTDMSGPITLQIISSYDDGHVPESGTAVVLLLAGLIALIGFGLTKL